MRFIMAVPPPLAWYTWVVRPPFFVHELAGDGGWLPR
jgi:hypothetical protein